MALRTYHETKWKIWILAPVLAYVIVRLVGATARDLISTSAPTRVKEAIYGEPEENWATTADGWISFGYQLAIIALSFFATRRLLVSIGNFFGMRSLTFERVQVWANLISECAETVRAPHMRPDRQAVSLRLTELRVRGARSMRGTVPAFSRRRPGLRKHANQVVAALRATHAGFDVDRKSAAQKLAALAIKISDRYAQGHVGALLDSEELSNPARHREAIHLAMLAGVMTMAGLSVQLLHLPASLAIGAVVIVSAWLYRSAASAGLVALAALLPSIFQGR